MQTIRVFLFLICGITVFASAMEEPTSARKPILAFSDIRVKDVCFIAPAIFAVASHNGDYSSTISIYDTKSKKPKCSFTVDNLVTSMTACDNLKKIAVSMLGRVVVFNSETGQLTREYKSYTRRVNSISAHPSFANTIISGSQDKIIQIWDLKSPDAQKIEGAHENDISTVKISKNPHYFISGSEDKTSKIWDWKTLQPLHVVKQLIAPHALEYNQQCDRFMISTNRVSRYDATSAAVMEIINRDGVAERSRGSKIEISNAQILSCASVGQDNQELLALGRDDGKTVLCYPERPKEPAYFLEPFASSISTLAFCPSGTCLVAGSQEDKQIQVFEICPRKNSPSLTKRASLKAGCLP